MNDEVKILEPLTFGDVFDEAFSLYKKHFVTFFGIVLIPSFIGFVIMLLAVPEALTLSQDQFEQMSVSQLLSILERMIVPTLITIFIGVVANAAFIKAIANAYIGKPVSIGGSYLYIVPRIIPYLLTLFLIGLFILLVGIGLGIVGLIHVFVSIITSIVFLIFILVFLLMNAFITEVVVVEDRKYLDAIKRSIQLTSGNRIWIIGVILIYFIISLIVGWGASQLTGMLNNGLLESAISQVFGILILPILFIPIVLIYFDSRVVNEGFDLELLASEMGDDGNEFQQ